MTNAQGHTARRIAVQVDELMGNREIVVKNSGPQLARVVGIAGATVLGDGIIDRDVALMSLKRMDVDALGLDELDRSLLRAIIEMYNGGPVGLETLAAALGEEAVTLEDLCEPYLMQMGFLTRTPRGRCATRLAYEHLGLKAPETGSPEDNGQQSLF